MVRPRVSSPLLSALPVDVTSCEHCRTVTWAGHAACGCEFARLAVDEVAVRRLCGDTAEPGELTPAVEVAIDDEIS